MSWGTPPLVSYRFFILQFIQRFLQGFLPVSFNKTWVTNAGAQAGGVPGRTSQWRWSVSAFCSRTSLIERQPLAKFPQIWHEFPDENIKIQRNKLIFNEELKKHFLDKLKGTVSRVFLLLVFFMNQFPPAPEYPIRIVSDFFENLRRYSQVKVHHGYQWHRWQNGRQYQWHWLQIFHCYQRHQRQILPPVSLVLLIPVANLLPWHQWQFSTGINNTGGIHTAL